MTKRILHNRKQFSVVVRLGMDQPFGGKPRLVQPRREQVAPPRHPQDLSRMTRGDPGQKQRRRGIIAPVVARCRNFVQGIDP